MTTKEISKLMNEVKGLTANELRKLARKHFKLAAKKTAEAKAFETLLAEKEK